MRKVSFINGICVRHDAISTAVRDSLLTLKHTGRYEPRLFAYECHFPELPFQQVEAVGDIMLDWHYQSSELVVFDFGITYPLFDLIAAVPRRAVRLVRFHNITPRQYVDEAKRILIDRSFAQLANMRFADHVLCVSETNRRVLLDAGLRIPTTILPLAVDFPAEPPVRKPGREDGVIRIAYVGRFVPSKGVLDLLAAAFRMLEIHPGIHLWIDLVGNLVFSDPAYLDRVKGFVETAPERVKVELRGSAEESEKWAILMDADLFVLPSYHEGFCVPVIEALAAGCRVITYDNSNLPDIGGGLSHLVPTGDCKALAQALADEVEDISSFDWQQDGGGYQGYRERARRYADVFSPNLVSGKLVALVDSLIEGPAPHRDQ